MGFESEMSFQQSMKKIMKQMCFRVVMKDIQWTSSTNQPSSFICYKPIQYWNKCCVFHYRTLNMTFIGLCVFTYFYVVRKCSLGRRVRSSCMSPVTRLTTDFRFCPGWLHIVLVLAISHREESLLSRRVRSDQIHHLIEFGYIVI